MGGEKSLVLVVRGVCAIRGAETAAGHLVHRYRPRVVVVSAEAASDEFLYARLRKAIDECHLTFTAADDR